MAKLYFRYGAMGASKSANALMVEYNYRERNQNAILLKPAIDDRDGKDLVKSRAGISKTAKLVYENSNIYKLTEREIEKGPTHCVIIDEAQFLKKKQIKQLTKIVDDLDIPVITYGLRTDFKGNLFEGSKWLLAWADSIEEIKTVCWCSRKATMNARVVNKKVIKQGEQIKIGGNESYIALCRKHWKRGELGK